MSTLSVPLPDDRVRQLEELVKLGIAANKADAVRKAIDRYLEEQAVERVLKAAKEPNLTGDLDELAAKLR